MRERHGEREKERERGRGRRQRERERSEREILRIIRKQISRPWALSVMSHVSSPMCPKVGLVSFRSAACAGRYVLAPAARSGIEHILMYTRERERK